MYKRQHYYEMGLVHPKAPSLRAPIYADGYRDGLDAVDSRGHVPVPTGPGLGVSYDWGWIEGNLAGLAIYD